MNDELQLKIEQYVSGSMSELEAKDFEQLMAESDALNTAVNLSKKFNAHLSGTVDDSAASKNEYTKELRFFLESEEAQELKEKLHTIQLERRLPHLRTKRRRVAFIAAAAAAIFVVSAIGLLFQAETGPDQLFATYYTANDLPFVITRGTSNALLERGATAFYDQEYTNALGYFEQYEASTEEPEIALHLYKGVALMQLERYYAAIEEFEIVIDSDSVDATKGFWFKAMAYLKSGDVTNAEYVLKDIASHVWYYNHEKAKELLEKLD